MTKLLMRNTVLSKPNAMELKENVLKDPYCQVQLKA